MRIFCSILVVFALSSPSSLVLVHAATLANVSDFEGSNKDGWQHPVANGNQTSIQSDGPFNDILLVTSSGSGGPGSRLVVPNETSPWIGNYTAAGITGVKMDLINNGSLTLSMRVAIEGDTVSRNRWVSTDALTLTPGQRGTFVFNLDSSSLSTAGGGDLAAALADVTQIRILHNSTPGDFKGAEVSGSFIVDNITLVPEPSSYAMILLGCVTLLFHRKTNHAAI